MIIYMDNMIGNLKNRLRLIDIAVAIKQECTLLSDDIIAGRLSSRLLWKSLLDEAFQRLPPDQVAGYLGNEENRKKVRAQMSAQVSPTIDTQIRSVLNIRPSDKQVAAINPKELGINPALFLETFYYDDETQNLLTFMDPDKVLIRVYHSLDHTLGQGAEAKVHIALMGCARKISDDPSIPIKQRYRPILDQNGNLIVSRNIMVAKVPKIQAKAGTGGIDIRRHQRGSLNLRDLTLPQFYTEESKKLLPGLWSLPRFADFGEDRSLYYEFVDGIAMHLLLKEREFNTLARLIVIKHVAQVLDYMHSRGYIHNDIKPQNVIIANDGVGTMIDFGLTEKYIETYKDLFGSMQQKIVGTPFYMAPEQVTKQSRGTFAVGEIKYATPTRSIDELAFLRREHPEKVVIIDDLEFITVAKNEAPVTTPYFYDTYFQKNFFSDEKGNVVPITGKADVFSLGVNMLYLVTGRSHLRNPENMQQILSDLSTCTLYLDNITENLPDPLCIEGEVTEEQRTYKSEFELLTRDMLKQNPFERPCAYEVARRLKKIIQLFFGGDRRFFNTFDEERIYVKNKLFRKTT